MTDAKRDLSPAAATLHDRLAEQAREIVARYPADRSRSALLPLLHLVQSVEGYVSPAGVEFCAAVLGLNKAQVGAVATFYTMYKRRPTGDWLVSVCTNTMCNVLGGQQVYDTLSEKLGVGHDETTADGTITLEHAECLAACDYGPVMTVNYEFFDQVDPDTATAVVDELRAGGRPTPTRGARLCTLKEMSLQLAGYADPRGEALADGRAGEPTLRGLRLAEQHGISVRGFDPDTPIRRREEGTNKPAEKPAPPTSVPPARTSSTAPDTKDPDVKDPQIRTAETRQPDARTPVPDAPGVRAPADGVPPGPSDARTAEAAGAASNPPAGDAKPAGDAMGAQARNLSDASGSPANGEKEAEK